MDLATTTWRVDLRVSAFTMLVLFYFVTFAWTRSGYSGWWCGGPLDSYLTGLRGVHPQRHRASALGQPLRQRPPRAGRIVRLGRDPVSGRLTHQSFGCFSLLRP